MPTSTWQTGQDIPAAGSYSCSSCGEQFEFESETQFPNCPTENKAVSWQEAMAVATPAGGQAGSQRQQGSEFRGGAQGQGGSQQTGRQTWQGQSEETATGEGEG